MQVSGQILQVVIGENDNNRGLLNFSMEAVTVEEGLGSQVTVQVTRSRGSFGSVSVSYSVVDGSTTAADYTPVTPDFIVFASGQQTADITILIVDDQIPEQDETFQVVLANAMGGAEIGTPSSVTVTILGNDDINGVFNFGDSSLLVSAASSKRSLASESFYHCRLSYRRLAVMVLLTLHLSQWRGALVLWVR